MWRIKNTAKTIIWILFTMMDASPSLSWEHQDLYRFVL